MRFVAEEFIAQSRQYVQQWCVFHPRRLGYGQGTCRLVGGTIDPKGWCEKFES
ncbi:MAG: hypothetical protein HIU89_15755 [Proteobacteria bacterium]|nr:hypothetical protein [Pseudomonadota bacterium]